MEPLSNLDSAGSCDSVISVNSGYVSAAADPTSSVSAPRRVEIENREWRFRLRGRLGERESGWEEVSLLAGNTHSAGFSGHSAGHIDPSFLS